GVGIQWCQIVSAVLDNGLGRYQDAFTSALRASEESPDLYMAMWALPELIEAAVRTANSKVAADAAGRLEDATAAAGTHWTLGINGGAGALVREGEPAEALYETALELLGRTQLRPELARAHLLYGEWLRRENRRVDARVQLRTAYEQFIAIGMSAFAERAR